MCSINVGIGHDNDLVISQFGNIEIIMDSCTECSDHCLDLGITVDLIQSCLLYIQDLSRAVFAEPPAESPSTM